ncbi:MAG: adenylate/guanylate cyclase domain-containing protein [Balneolales bacterium]
MIRLIYISKRKDHVSDEDILEIAGVLAAYNQEKNVTGIISCWDIGFIQILEGNETEVMTSFKKNILNDSRLCNVTLLSQEVIVTRNYPGLPMKLIDLDDENQSALFPMKDILKLLSEKVIDISPNGSMTPGNQKSNGKLVRPSQIIEKIVFFSDIVSFSALSQTIEPTMVVQLLNKYINLVTSQVLYNNGKVSKMLGDGVLAYFEGNQVDNAIEASMGILTTLHQIREDAAIGSAEKILHTGIGLASGPVIEGDIGSDSNTDFTIIGDSVNLASRLESMTRSQKLALIFSREVKDKLSPKWKVFDMGKHIIKGKKEPIDLYSINSSITKKALTGIELEWEIGNYLLVNKGS